MFEKNTQNIKVFVSDVSDEILNIRNMLHKILERAGMQIIYPNEKGNFIEEDLKEIEKADCTIHILGHSYNIFNGSSKISLSELQYKRARESSSYLNNLKIFVWYPESSIQNEIQQEQEDFINEVRNNISANMVFSDHISPIAFVEDVISIMNTKTQKEYDTTETEIFFIYNDLDEDDANEIADLLSDIAKVKKLNVIQNSDEDYSELVSAQMKKSKLSVVYFKKTADWAMPFVQQIWKKIGGASSNSEILLIGDANNENNAQKILSLPKVESQIVAGELIPLEIKVLFDKINRNE